MTEKPRIAATEPVEITLKAGRKYFFCTCGHSAKQPFCDGSHKGTEFSPLAFDVAEDCTKWLCQCKQSGDKPFCDGTHNGLTGTNA